MMCAYASIYQLDSFWRKDLLAPYCPDCNWDTTGVFYCPNCNLPPQLPYCPNCNLPPLSKYEIDDDALVKGPAPSDGNCPNCNLNEETPTSKEYCPNCNLTADPPQMEDLDDEID